MAETEVAEADAPAIATEGGTVMKIPVKAGGSVEINTRDIPDNVYHAALAIGMKDLVNRGMTKITTKGLEGKALEDAKAAAQKKAEENLAALRQGKLPRIAGQKADSGKIPGVVMTEARRLAKNLIKDEIKKAGGKISHYEAKDITAAANAYLESDEGKALIVEATANVAKRTAMVEAKGEEGAKSKLADLGLKASDKKVAAAVAKAEKEKAAKEAGGAVLSAAKAGQVKTRTPKGARA